MRPLVWVGALALAAAGAVASAQTPDVSDLPASAAPSERDLSIATPTLKFGPAPSWVKPVEAPQSPQPFEGGPLQVLLQDQQVRLSDAGDEFYVHTAIKVLNQAGLAALGTFQVNWAPDTASLTLHRLRILRGGQAIDLLGGGEDIFVLRRETKLERATLDGQLTATETVPGLRIGDVLESEYTLRRFDPVLGGRSQATLGMTNLVTISTVGRWRARLVWPDSKTVVWRATGGLPTPAMSHADGWSEVMLDVPGAHLPPLPADAPARYQYQRRIEATQFATWNDISSVMAPLFARAMTLQPQSALRAEAAKIAAATPIPAIRARMALELVQSQIRYQAINLDDGGYVPAPAEQTWRRRYGDCKGKTVVLLALLQELGIDAEPVLVNTLLGDGLDAQLPQLSDFNHVIVHAEIAGRGYWLDGAKPGDPKALDDIAPPPFHWGLPLATNGAALVKIDPLAPQLPLFEGVDRIDASAGIADVAPRHSRYVLRGDLGLAFGAAANAMPGEAAETFVRGLLQKISPRSAAAQVSWNYDPTKGAFTIESDDRVPLRWLWNRDTSQYLHPMADGDAVHPFVPPKRDPTADPSAPFAVAYPLYNTFRTEIVLPRGGAGFQLVGRTFNQTVGATAFTRSARLVDGEAVFETSLRGVAPEFAAIDLGNVVALAMSVNSNPVVLVAPRGASGPAEALASPRSDEATVTLDTDPPAKEIPLYRSRF